MLVTGTTTGIAVGFGGRAVAVGGNAVAVGTTGVAVAGTGVAVGGTWVAGDCVGGGAIVAGPAHAVAMMLAKQAIINFCFIIVIYSF